MFPAKNSLLCSFSNEVELDRTLANIFEKYSVAGRKVFVLLNVASPRDLFLTYNIDTSKPVVDHLKSTILMHRNKDTNTLYTINALNSLIRSLNDGRLDSTFRIDWQNYTNTIILVGENGPRIIKTKLKTILVG